VDFDRVGKGLTTPQDEPVTGFAVAGSDRHFVWAQAKIEGNSVVVWSDQVPAPAAVRYAWAGQVSWANLYGKNELPVLTFRTDDWPQAEKP
jgi:sialate O-acetylesterase